MKVCNSLRLVALLPATFLFIGCDNKLTTRSDVPIPVNDRARPTQSETPRTQVTPNDPSVPAGTGTSNAKDNTGINTRDRDSATKTPIDQDENQSDVNTTASIRKRVVSEKNLSVNAQNVKIITSQGKVTLRGPVSSEQERALIVNIAKDVVGADNVDNQIEIAP